MVLGVCEAHLVHANGGHLYDLSDSVHGCQVEPAIVLLLGKVEQRYARALLVVCGEAAEDLCHLQCSAGFLEVRQGP